jgi:hypothetical protein
VVGIPGVVGNFEQLFGAATKLGESGSSPDTKSSAIEVRHESEVESLAESIAIGIGFSPSDLGGNTIKAAEKRDVENTRGPLSLLIKDESNGVTTALEEGVKYNSAWILEMLCRKLGHLQTLRP